MISAHRITTSFPVFKQYEGRLAININRQTILNNHLITKNDIQTNILVSTII